MKRSEPRGNFREAASSGVRVSNPELKGPEGRPSGDAGAPRTPSRKHLQLVTPALVAARAHKPWKYDLDRIADSLVGHCAFLPSVPRDGACAGLKSAAPTVED
jgi:hypothetical protein